MPVFQDYARYYNMLYADKDYTAETAFILSCFTEHMGKLPKTVLDLGCGTGSHALKMAEQGIAVTGVDMSDIMLRMGQEALHSTVRRDGLLPILQQGDARTVRLEQKFEAVTSLFHVMSYQNSEQDALAVFKTAYEHLQPGGCFIFDFWYGPGVLTDPPVCREKVLENDSTHILRKARPVARHNDNIIEVHYAVDILDKATQTLVTLNEQHNMRYWFLPELRYLAKESNFCVISEGEWLKNAIINSTWTAWMLLQK